MTLNFAEKLRNTADRPRRTRPSIPAARRNRYCSNTCRRTHRHRRKIPILNPKNWASRQSSPCWLKYRGAVPAAMQGECRRRCRPGVRHSRRGCPPAADTNVSTWCGRPPRSCGRKAEASHSGDAAMRGREWRRSASRTGSPASAIAISTYSSTEPAIRSESPSWGERLAPTRPAWRSPRSATTGTPIHSASQVGSWCICKTDRGQCRRGHTRRSARAPAHKPRARYAALRRRACPDAPGTTHRLALDQPRRRQPGACRPGIQGRARQLGHV